MPLLSRNEGNADFLAKALENVEETVLLLVVDKDAMIGQFGFAATEIMQGNQLLEELSEKIKAQKIKCEDILEWGNTEQKILQLAELKKADKIVLLKQGNKYFEDLLKKLQKSKIEIQAIELPSQTTEEIQNPKIEEKKIEENSVSEAKKEKPIGKKEFEKQNTVIKKIDEKKASEKKSFNPFDFLKKIKFK